MDEADRASQEVEYFRTEAQRQRKPEGPRYTGRCLWCGEIVGGTMRWCSVECTREWEREAAREKASHAH